MRTKDNTRVGHLYCIYSPEQDAVKFGFSETIYQRLKSLQTGNPEELHLRGWVRTVAESESIVHELLKGHNVRLEWYPDSDVTWSFFNELQDEALDMAMEYLAENMPNAEGPHALDQALDEILVPPALVRELLLKEIEHWRSMDNEVSSGEPYIHDCLMPA